MKRKKINSLVLLTVLFIGNAFAQKDKPNFSGSWDFDKSETTLFSGGHEQSGLGQFLYNCSIKLLIEHNEPEIIVRKDSICENPNKANKTWWKSEAAARYYTDGRGEVNTTSENEVIESKTEWKGNKIITVYYKINAKNGKKKTVFIKELDISKDNQKLTEKSAGSKGDFASSYTKMVFRISK